LDIAQQVYVYCIVGVVFGSVAVGLGLSKLNRKWLYSTLVVAIVLTAINAVYFDIGAKWGLDPEMSAEKFYHEELAKIPDGEKFMGGGWTWAMTYLYNREEGRNIIPISIDALTDEHYWKVLDKMGVKYEPSESDSYITAQGEIALSIAKLNDDVWIAKETKPEVYQYEIVQANGNEGYIGRWIGQEIESGNWRWKPSNPWSYVSGKLEIREWHHILWSSHNAFYVISMAVYGWFVIWLVFRYIKHKKKNNAR
jgi:hypothetical protein